MNILLVTGISGLVKVIILISKDFTTLKYVNYDNLQGRQRRPCSLIYSFIFFYVDEFG